MLRGYIRLYSLPRNSEHLLGHCKRCWNKILYLLPIGEYLLSVLMKDELGGKIMTAFTLRAKKYSYLTDDKDENKKGTKKCVKKRQLRFKNFNYWLEATQLENRIN